MNTVSKHKCYKPPSLKLQAHKKKKNLKQMSLKGSVHSNDQKSNFSLLCSCTAPHTVDSPICFIQALRYAALRLLTPP